MTPREKLECAYALAFHPPTLNALWGRLKRGQIRDRGVVGELLQTAYVLHLALPEGGYASHRALLRLATYQANARAFGMPRFLRNLLRHVRVPPPPDTVVPGRLVRDIALPAFCHHPAGAPPTLPALEKI